MHFPVTVMPQLHFALKNTNHRSFFHLISVSTFSLFHQLKLSSDTPYAAITVFLIINYLHRFRFSLTIVALQLLSFCSNRLKNFLPNAFLSSTIFINGIHFQIAYRYLSISLSVTFVSFHENNSLLCYSELDFLAFGSFSLRRFLSILYLLNTIIKYIQHTVSYLLLTFFTPLVFYQKIKFVQL